MGKKNVKEAKKKNKIWRVIKLVILIGASMVFAFIAFFAVKLFNLDAWENFDSAKIVDASCSLIIYDKDENELLRLDSGEDRIPVSIDDVPNIVQKAFISIEDARFYEHNGIDIVRIFGAILADIKAGGYVQGASTISQQLVKLSHLSTEKTIMRKLEEAVLAYQMEKEFTKDEILEMYLNFVYFGGGFYGIEAAARGYFGVTSSELTVEQGATLAAILKSPTQYAPHLDIEASKERRNLVLKLMHENGYLNESEMLSAQTKPVEILDSINSGIQKRGYYIDEAVKTACNLLEITNEELLCGGYRIYTCLDSELQSYCELLFENKNLFPDDKCEGALVVKSSGSGFIEAMIGGRNSENAMSLNRAADIKRQPGSVIKPIICYAPALESGKYTAATMILDEEYSFGDYSPQNYGDKYNGYVTLREAVTSSLNIPAVKVLKDISVETGKRFASACGIEFDEKDTSLTLALGGFTYGVSPVQVANAYSVFASGGIYNEGTIIKEIRDKNDKILYQYKDESKRVMSRENAYILTSMLSSVVKDGTGRRLGELGIPLAGKTGTVDESNLDGNRDAWMAAYNSEYTAVVWMGYDTSSNGMALPDDATGGKYPAIMLKELFSKIYENKEAPDFQKPNGVVNIKLDARAMEMENRVVLASFLTPKESIKSEIFKMGTEPSTVSEYWQIPKAAEAFKAENAQRGEVHISFNMPDDFAVYRLYRINGDTKILLGEWNGSTKAVDFYDKSVNKDTEYTYFVLPIHSELYLNGKQVSGVESEKVTVKTPMMVYFGTDEIIKDTESGF